jgi:SAM-dependent methyltransferase
MKPSVELTVHKDQAADFSRYDSEFYGDGGDLAFKAARIILNEVTKYHVFGSLVDFGCGAGGWLRAATELIGERIAAEPRVLGIDGPYAKPFAVCERAEFRFQNLEARVSEVGRFDIAISMEVAEHLTANRASTFVEDIVASSDVVLFSAAIPGQGGDNHINEQWQSHWVHEFARLGYRCFDVLRPEFWCDKRLALCPFYVGNGFLYVRIGNPLENVLISRGVSVVSPAPGYPTDVVHPGVFKTCHFGQAGPTTLVSSLPRALVRAVSKRMRGQRHQ